MKKNLIFLFILTLSSFLNAQTGINTSNPQGTFHIDGAKDNPPTGAPSAAQAANDIIATSAGKVGIGNVTPNANLDVRPNPTSTSTPGDGFLGLGTTPTAAPAAGAGALRYSTVSGGVVQYSNGVVWNTFTSTVQKSIVVARKLDSQAITNSSVTNIINWTKDTDSNNDFNAATGVFTAPRDGNYIITYNLLINNNLITAPSTLEAQLYSSTGAIKVGLTAFSSTGTYYGATNITIALKMVSGETLRPACYQSTGRTQNTRAANGLIDYVNFSVAEL